MTENALILSLELYVLITIDYINNKREFGDFNYD